MEKLVGEFLIFLATIDPVSTLLIFVALTGALPPKDRRRLAWRAIGYSAGILVGFIVLGELFLNSIGIRLAAFQLAGGIIFFLFGFQMVFGRGPGYRDSSPEPGHNVAVFPLAVPSIACHTRTALPSSPCSRRSGDHSKITRPVSMRTPWDAATVDLGSSCPTMGMRLRATVRSTGLPSSTRVRAASRVAFSASEYSSPCRCNAGITSQTVVRPGWATGRSVRPGIHSVTS